MRLLLANPNTSAAMADVMAAEARRVAAPGTVIDVCSAPFGSPYISTRAEAALAAHGLLQALADHWSGHDAVIVGAFIIPTVTEAAKEAMPVPVLSTGEAGLALARVLARRFAILSIGDPARKMTHEMVEALGHGDRTAAILDLGFSGTDLTARQHEADTRAISLCGQAVTDHLADAVVLGAGSMEGMARRIQPRAPVPVISPVGAAVGLAETLVRQAVPKATAGSHAAAHVKDLTGIDPALARLLRRDT